MRCFEGESLAGEIISNPFQEVPSPHTLGLISLSTHSEQDVLKLWTDLIDDYTQRSLSHRTDTLIAVGALAKEFHKNHKSLLGRYLGGLWENHIRSGLLWHSTVDASVSSEEQDSLYVAPSWSWASCPWRPVAINQPEIHLPSGEYTDTEFYTPRWYCEVLGCNVVLKSDLDLYGALKDGFLDIRGPLRPLQRRSGRSDDDGADYREPETKSQDCPNLYLHESVAEALILDRPLVIPDHTGNHEPQYYWLGVWYAGRGRARGLIVQKVDDTNFRRLGFAAYVVALEEFPSSDLHNERLIRLV